MRLRNIVWGLALLLTAGLFACQCDNQQVDDLDAGTSGRDGSGSGWYIDDSGAIVVTQDGGVAIEEEGGYIYVCMEVSCYGQQTSCGNCEDDDGDGVVDYRDPECLGPCDNTEGPGLESGVGGTTGTSCGVDCYFDWGNGPGNDQCMWDHRCDPLDPESPTCAYDPDFVATHGDRDCPDVQPEQCVEFCLPITPNGCDCFGCCTFPELEGQGPDGSNGHVWIGNMDEDNNSTCTLDDVTDPTLCPPCTPVPNCLNECGRCEICVGRPVPDESCWNGEYDGGGGGGQDAGGGTGNDAGGTGGPDGGGSGVDVGGGGGGGGQCPEGMLACGLPGQPECPAGMYCITGCCVLIEG